MRKPKPIRLISKNETKTTKVLELEAVVFIWLATQTYQNTAKPFLHKMKLTNTIELISQKVKIYWWNFRFVKTILIICAHQNLYRRNTLESERFDWLHLLLFDVKKAFRKWAERGLKSNLDYVVDLTFVKCLLLVIHQRAKIHNSG